ncbi:substrate-binding domain-containing protein [Streptomyces sp. NPDC055400]
MGFSAGAKSTAAWAPSPRFDAQIRVLPNDSTEQAGEQAGRRLLSEGELPTAVVAFNDRSAIGVLTTLRAAGVQVPGRVSVAGYDALSRLSCFNLTTVSQNPGTIHPGGAQSSAWTAAVPVPARRCSVRAWSYGNPQPQFTGDHA